jgi:polar amino acid transport system substrate-binding protein
MISLPGHGSSVVGLVMAVMSACPAAAADIEIFASETPPFAYFDADGLAGVFPEVAKLIFAEAGISYGLTIAPWARAYKSAETNPTACVVPTTQTAERKPKFKWIYPVAPTEWRFYVLPESGIAINSLDDARKYIVGVYNGDVKERYLNEVGGFHLEVVSADSLNARKLAMHRIDVWAAGISAVSAAKAEKVGIRNAYTFMSLQMGFACNNGVPDTTIAALQAALDRIRVDGRLDRIVKAGIP